AGQVVRAEADCRTLQSPALSQAPEPRPQAPSSLSRHGSSSTAPTSPDGGQAVSGIVVTNVAAIRFTVTFLAAGSVLSQGCQQPLTVDYQLDTHLNWIG